MKQEFKYQAFISYAHADEAAARRIHNALETYPIPTDMDLAMRKKLTPIFRDVTELTAHHSLSEKIQEAVKTSRFLIVLCSPSAKLSHWVNEEIELFRRLHGESAILSVIVDGEPETAFPPALTKDGREPLAANMTTREGFRFGVSQLAASMLGVGLDRLVQRDTKRRRKRMQLITTGALLFAGVMGGMAWTAVDARDEAEVSRSEAEKMVEFMLTDLKDELEPLGRLSVLDDVGTRVTDYYDAIPLPDMDDDRLARQARARHLLGQVALEMEDLERAKREANISKNLTSEILRRSPEDQEAIFNHAQSLYWLGRYHFQDKNPSKTQELWKEYNDLATSLYESEMNNVRWILEAGNGEGNMGFIEWKFGNIDKAIRHYDTTIMLYREGLKYDAQNTEVMENLAQSLAGAAAIAKTTDQAIHYRSQNIQTLERLIRLSPNDMNLEFQLTRSNFKLAVLNEKKSKAGCRSLGLKQSMALMEDISKNDPSNAIWRKEQQNQMDWFTENCVLN